MDYYDYFDLPNINETYNFTLPNSSIQCPEPDHHLHIYATYIIAALGSVSNVIAFVVLVGSRRMRTSPCGLFLIMLAVADTCVLLGELLSTLTSYISGEVHTLSDIECGILWYFKYYSKAVSNFIIVCISVNRFLAVAYPIKSLNSSNTKLALQQIIAVILIAAIIFLYVPFFMQNEGCGCDINLNYKDAYFLATVVVNLGICDVLTSLVILILSLCTIFVIVYSRKKLQQQNFVYRPERQRKVEQYQLTGLLIVVCMTFFFLRLPYLITWIILYMTDAFSRSVILINARNISYCVALLNYAINLYIYSVCSSLFRKEFRNLCRCTRNKTKIGRRSRFPSASRSSISVRKSSASVMQTCNTAI